MTIAAAVSEIARSSGSQFDFRPVAALPEVQDHELLAPTGATAEVK